MAYYNGSIWPHHNALIAAGLSASPSKDLAVRILSAQLGDGSVDLTLYRYSGAVDLNVDRRSGKLDVAILT